MRISTNKREEVRQVTVDALEQMIRFYVGHKGIKYIHEEKARDWRSLVDSLHISYPISGVRVHAKKNGLRKIEVNCGGFLEFDYPLAPEYMVDDINSYPIDAASASYLFTILEVFGDSLVEKVNPGSLKERHAWHRKVHGDCDLSNKDAIEKAKIGIRETFKLTRRSIPNYAIERLVKLKNIRNEFAHNGDSLVDFDEFFSNSVATVLFLYYFLLPKAREIRVYPFEVYEELETD